MNTSLQRLIEDYKPNYVSSASRDSIGTII